MIARRILIVFFAVLLGGILVRVHDTVKVNDLNEFNDPEPALREGVYTGVGEGFAGEIKLEVRFERVDSNVKGDVEITGIQVLYSEDIERYWNPVLDKLKPAVIEKQTTDIDAVTGATSSSRGFLNAVRDAKRKAYKGN